MESPPRPSAAATYEAVMMNARSRIHGKSHCRRWSAGLLCLAASLAPIAGQSTPTYLPSIKIGTAALISPSAANAYYGSGTTSTDYLATLTGVETPTPPEIIELARALKNNVDTIYQYVHNNIQPVWMYGLQKGALGAEIDKSGTPFDQAELMVALLRQSNYTASYIAGTVVFNQAQFAAWTNITNARAACQLLANGGIPAKVNGVTNALCSSIDINAAVSSIQMAHIWVRVTISGTNYVFDPSYKSFTWKAGVPLAVAMNFVSGTPLNDLKSGSYTHGTTSGVNWANALNTAELDSDLQTYSTNLLSYIQSHNLQGAQIEDIVSGGVIVPDNSTLRQTTLPYHDPNPPYAAHTWTPSADTARYNAIPDQYRTRLQVDAWAMQFIGGNWMDEPMFTTSPNFFADEIYGRRLTMETNYNIANVHAQPDYLKQNACLALDDQPWGSWGDNNNPTPPPQCLLTYSYGPMPAPYAETPARSNATHIKLTANHPYAASADGTPTTNGDYMDGWVDKQVGALVVPLTIVAAWGNVGPDLFKKWSEERATDSLMPNLVTPPWCAHQIHINTCPQNYYGPTGGFDREKLAASWLAQVSRAAILNGAIANSIPQIHHMLGFLYADAYLQGVNPQSNMEPPDFYVGDSFTRVDIDAGISFTSRTASAPARRAAIQAFAATSATLEGSITGQMDDVVDMSSTATRFEWGNSPDSNALQNPYGIGPQNFYAYNSGNYTQAANLTKVDGAKTGSCSGSGSDMWTSQPTFTSNQCAGMITNLSNWIGYYASQSSWTVVASGEAFLGPGQRGGTIYPTLNQQGNPTSYMHDTGKQRGGAFVALQTDSNGDPLQIAHIIVGPGGLTKGGGGADEPTDKTTYDPAKAADLLKAHFVDRSTLFGVNLSNGSLGYSSPVSISIGSGGFPYELSASLSWHPGSPPNGLIAPTPPISPQSGWNHSWLNNLTLSGSGLEAMGQSDIRAAVGAIVAFYATQDIYLSDANPSVERETGAVLAQSWWAHQVTANVATVNIGGSARQLLKIADGTWIQPGSSFASFTQTNDRVPYEEKCFHIYVDTPPYNLARGWDSSSVSFTLTNAQGDSQKFGYFENPYYTDETRVCGHLKGFRMTEWDFPQGNGNLKVTPNYTALPYGVDMFDTLTSVSNTVGRSIAFNPTSISTATRSITLSDSSTQPAWMKDAMLNQTSFTYTPPQDLSPTVRPVPYSNLASITTPDNPAQHNTEYYYDSLGRVDQVLDAVAIQKGTRGPYNFFIADGTRGERDDPLSQTYTVVYDTYGHPSRYLDELGIETDALFDSRGRAMQYIYPEGDCEAFSYDDHNNTTNFWTVDKTSACNTAAGAGHVLHASAVWDQTWNKPASLTDARGNTTMLQYFGSGNGKSLIETVTLPAIAEGTPVYQYDYDTKGRLANATNPSGIVTHNDFDANENLTAVTRDYSTGGGHLNLKTQFLYDLDGNVQTTIDPRNNATTSVWDADRRKTEDDHHMGNAFSDLNAAEKTLYDAVSRVTDNQRGTSFTGTTVNQWLTVKHTTYTPTSKVETVTDADNSTTTNTYDNDDRIQNVQDPVLRNTHFAYCAPGDPNCAANQVKTEWRAWSSGTACSLAPPSLQECYRRVSYGADGEMATIEDANNNITAYGYDGWNRLTTSTFPDATFEQLTLDENGNVTLRQNRAQQQLTYTYDALNQMRTKVSPSPALTTTWTYLLDGRVNVLSDTATNSINYGYDTAGRLNQVVNHINGFGANRTVNYTLDANGNRTQLKWPSQDAAYAVGYCYDNLNRMTQAMENATDCATNLLATYAYDAQSRRTLVTYGNGATMSYPSYSNAGDLQTLTSHFPVGSNDNSFTYTYTAAHQTLTATASKNTWFWEPSTDSTTAYTVNNLNQYATVGSQTTGGTNCQGAAQGLSYDCNGNLTFDGTRTYTYDAENRLLMANATGLAATYAYDPLGRRTKKSGTGVTTTYYLSDGTDEIAEYDSTKTVTVRYIPGPSIDEPIAMETASTGAKEYFHTDKQGSVSAMSDATGALVEGPYTYDPYGNCFVGSTPCSATGVPYRFTGRRFDAETGLYYYRARYYDPAKGRFLQTDPVGYEVDLNLYTYVGNDPSDESDPTGNCDASRIGAAPDSICRGTRDPNNPNASAGSPNNHVTHPTGAASGNGNGAGNAQSEANSENSQDNANDQMQLATKVCHIVVVTAGIVCGGVAVGSCILTEGGGCIFVPGAVEVCTAAAGSAIGGCVGSAIVNANRPPPGSRPIDQTPWSGDHQQIKRGVGASPSDRVKIAPNGDVWVERPDGSWENMGHAGNYTGSGRPSGRRGKDRDQ